MIGPTHPVDQAIDPGALAVRRLYAKYLADAGIGFDELLILAEVHDGHEYQIVDLAANLNLDVHVVNSMIDRLERAKFIDLLYPSSSRTTSIRLVTDVQRFAARLLVIQANVDLDLSVVCEQVNRLRRSLLLLTRRSAKRSEKR